MKMTPLLWWDMDTLYLFHPCLHYSESFVRSFTLPLILLSISYVIAQKLHSPEYRYQNEIVKSTKAPEKWLKEHSRRGQFLRRCRREKKTNPIDNHVSISTHKDVLGPLVKSSAYWKRQNGYWFRANCCHSTARCTVIYKIERRNFFFLYTFTKLLIPIHRGLFAYFQWKVTHSLWFFSFRSTICNYRTACSVDASAFRSSKYTPISIISPMKLNVWRKKNSRKPTLSKWYDTNELDETMQR